MIVQRAKELDAAPYELSIRAKFFPSHEELCIPCIVQSSRSHTEVEVVYHGAIFRASLQDVQSAAAVLRVILMTEFGAHLVHGTNAQVHALFEIV